MAVGCRSAARAGRSADRAPSSRPELEITKKESATAPPPTSPSNPAASCRCTGQADRAGRADQMASRRPASRARVRAAQAVNAVPLTSPAQAGRGDADPAAQTPRPAPTQS